MNISWRCEDCGMVNLFPATICSRCKKTSSEERQELEEKKEKTKITLPIIIYKQQEPWHAPELCRDNLLVFMYQIPYFGACGVFPPHHILNEIFLMGGIPGGMSLSVSWTPFTISKEEYDTLVMVLQDMSITEIKETAPYVPLPVKFDHDFDHIKGYFEWLHAVCEKHRNSHHTEFKKMG